MILHVLKHPDPQTLAHCLEADDLAPVPEGREAMTVAEFEAWKAAEIEAGWKPAVDVKNQLLVPSEVTPRQFRLALLAVEIDPANITAMLDGESLIEWEYASSIRRDHPLIDSLADTLGKTSEEVDAIFINANGL